MNPTVTVEKSAWKKTSNLQISSEIEIRKNVTHKQICRHFVHIKLRGSHQFVLPREASRSNPVGSSAWCHALWARSSKKPDVRTWPLALACPFVHSLAPLTRSLALLTPLLMGQWMIGWLFFLCFFLFWTIMPWFIDDFDTSAAERGAKLGPHGATSGRKSGKEEQQKRGKTKKMTKITNCRMAQGRGTRRNKRDIPVGCLKYHCSQNLYWKFWRFLKSI